MGHYGCNTNGEHERCGELSCGWFEQCKRKNQIWFEDEELVMSERKIDALYELLERAEKEKDEQSIGVLRWAIFQLENSEKGEV